MVGGWIPPYGILPASSARRETLWARTPAGAHLPAAPFPKFSNPRCAFMGCDSPRLFFLGGAILKTAVADRRGAR